MSHEHRFVLGMDGTVCKTCGVRYEDWTHGERVARIVAQRDELLAACEYGRTNEYRSIIKDAVSKLRQSSGVDVWLSCELEKKSNMEEAAIASAKGDSDALRPTPRMPVEELNQIKADAGPDAFARQFAGRFEKGAADE